MSILPVQIGSIKRLGVGGAVLNRASFFCLLVTERDFATRTMHIGDFPFRHLYRREKFYANCHRRQRFRPPPHVLPEQCLVGERPEEWNEPIIFKPLLQTWTPRFPWTVSSGETY